MEGGKGHVRQTHQPANSGDLLDEVVVEVELLEGGEALDVGDLLNVVLAQAECLQVSELGDITGDFSQLLLDQGDLLKTSQEEPKRGKEQRKNCQG